MNLKVDYDLQTFRKNWLHKRHIVNVIDLIYSGTVKFGNKERFDKEQIGIKEPFPVTNLPFTS